MTTVLDWLKANSDLSMFQAGGGDPTKPLPGETAAHYHARQAVLQSGAAIGHQAVNAVNGVGNFASYLFSPIQQPPSVTTPLPPARANPFPTSFNDPTYSAADMAASQQTGVPAALISAVRQRGERTNAGVRSVAGANTPYQITPGTRQGIIKNYGIDPWSSPQNAALGAAYVLREQAGNPGPKDWTAQLATRAVGGYFGGAAGAANPFSTAIKDANGQSVGGYTQQVLTGKTGLPAPFLNPYDPSYDRAAMGKIGAERQALMTPFAANINVGPAPEMPKPQDIPTEDFSKSDAALQDLKPIEMTAKEQMQRERDGFFQGIAKAMLSTSGNEGLGTLFMKLGAGALAGKMGARDDIRAEQDKFDTEMAKFHAAVFNNELNKANVHAAEAQKQVDQNNAYVQANYTNAYNRWAHSGSIDISGTNAVIQQKDDKGNISVRTIPIAGAVDAAIAQQAGQLFQGMGGRQMAGNQQVAGMTNAMIGRAAIDAMNGGSGAEADAAAAAAPAFYGSFIATHGLTGDLLGPDGAKSLEESVTKQLTSQQIMPGSKEWLDRHDRLVATEIAKLGVADPTMMQKIMKVGATAGNFNAMSRFYGRSERDSVNAKGQPTTSTTYDGNASDIFGQ